MTIIDALQDFCDDFGYDLRTDYVGRGMMGRSCIGIVGKGKIDDIVQLCDYLRDLDWIDSAYEALGEVIKTDTMGLDKIIYFPNIREWDGSEQSDD